MESFSLARATTALKSVIDIHAFIKHVKDKREKKAGHICHFPLGLGDI